MDENLNIDFHTKRLMLKALNKFRFQHQAVTALGITRYRLKYLKQYYGIVRVEGNEWQSGRWQVRESSPSMRPLQSVA